MLGTEPDRLLATRVYSALVPSSHSGDAIGKQEAVRRAIEYAGDSPTEELARALIAQAQYLFRHGHLAASLEAAQRAIDAAGTAGNLEAEGRPSIGGPSPVSTSATSLTRRRDGTDQGPGTNGGRGRARPRRRPRDVHGGRTGRSWPVHRERGLRGGHGAGASGPSDRVRGHCAASAPVARPTRRGRTAARGARWPRAVRSNGRWQLRARRCWCPEATRPRQPFWSASSLTMSREAGQNPVAPRGPDRVHARGDARRPARRSGDRKWRT